MPTALPTTPSTLLDAVNFMLASIGEAPVSTLTGDIGIWAERALKYLSADNRMVQAKGWWFNTYEGYTLELDEDSKIPTPANVLSVTTDYWNRGATPNAIEKNGFLYNPLDHTDIFTEDLQVDMILLEDFETLPEVARHFITLSATQRFQAVEQGSSIVYRVLDADLATAAATLEQEQDRNRPRNAITGNRAVLSMLYGRGVRRRPIGR